ncbi:MULTISPECIES: cell division protein FtsZ [Psychrilyobacter]|uniref:Cell division protein FtsZ n=1 Tax=Psychrilyobacter piezotolerans TaxID=2293438 RepID=A0ABX9KFJ1_9FUSO|nr:MULTISPECIES: cell division protein FtsZ [Psychrilyobacter]MCS5421549.1 cell division protein FtsZ [Psychrilyobacter sp. S5]NDI78672.1 cell division protein FtsZ [Psychrilyobacter piezotolerans]RDE60023.1 cell division protein FtsZ [Psychrilyobacter sp. S5]REI40250.1 cell division protein FtsZ [Psychrilyobacter piezotolerans]
MIHTNEHLVKIKVMGIGGSGGNAINDMIEAGVTGVEYIAANTDAQDLHNSLADIRIQLGEKSTRGLGAGANPEIGKQAAEEDIDKIKTLLEETDMLFITSGMGGGTGTGAAPVIARVAKDMGILTVAVVTKPFTFEGKNRMKNADMGIVNLKESVDALIIIPNDKLFELPEKTITLQNAFMEANNVLKIGIKGLADLILKTGLINLDFADIKTTMLDSGVAMIGFGEMEGENRAIKATEKALQSPLLEKSISGASKILINISGSSALGLNEAFAISNMVKEAAGKSVDDVMFGVTTDDEMGDRLQVTLVATNFSDEATEKKVVAIEKPSLAKTVEKKEEEDLEIPAWMRRNN